MRKIALTFGIMLTAMACFTAQNASAQVVTSSSYYGVSYGSPFVVTHSPVVTSHYVGPVVRPVVRPVLGPRVVATGVVAPRVIAPRVIASRVIAPRVIAPRVVAPRIVAPVVVRPRIAPVARTTRAAAFGVRAVVARPFVRRIGF